MVMDTVYLTCDLNVTRVKVKGHGVMVSGHKVKVKQGVQTKTGGLTSTLICFFYFSFDFCFWFAPSMSRKDNFLAVLAKKKKNIKLCTTVQSFFFLARHESPLRDLLTMKYIADCPNKNMNIIDSSYKCMIWQHMRFVFVFDSEKDITTLVIYQGFCYTGIMRVQCILRETVPSSQF